MPFEIVRNDITRMETDAIVNAANSSLAPGGGVCGAIFASAGYDRLERACRAIGHCDVGQAVITSGFSLPAKYIIHTVGPIWRGGKQKEEALLYSCYTRSLELAERQGCRSIAFPLISSGIFGYPKKEAFQIAVDAIRAFLQNREMRVILVMFDQGAVILGEKLLGSIQTYIDDHYADVHRMERLPTEYIFQRRQLREQDMMPPVAASVPSEIPSSQGMAAKRSLAELMDRLEESFSTMLLRLIDEKGMTDVEVYKRANIDRKHFSKLRKEGYNPSKQTAVALAVALRLNLDETRDLLSRAGYALSHSSKADVILEYFITQGIYDIYEINEALFAFDQRLLGA